MNDRKERLIIKLIKYFPRKIKRKLTGYLEDNVNSQTTRISELCYQMNALTCMVARMMTKDNNFQFYGQVNQDLFAYLFFNGKKDGFYIDIGANDGITMSNTYIFEQLGWAGICVEPLPDIFSKLRQNRKCACYNAAVAAESGNEINFIRASNVEGLSGLESEMTEAHKKRIVNENGKIEPIKVKTLSFDDLMNDYRNSGGGGGRTYIDFMSIDVEGAEMSILKAIDFKKYSFGLITVENNEEIEGTGEKLRKFMAEKGYKVFMDLGLDIMFTK